MQKLKSLGIMGGAGQTETGHRMALSQSTLHEKQIRFLKFKSLKYLT